MMQVNDIAQISVQEELEGELEYLKQKLDMGYHLKVRWDPQENLELCGQVKDDVIYVYEENLQNAIETLRHEFIDYVISQAIEPYKKMVNTMIRLQNKDAYEKKERIVEGVRRLLE